MNDKYIEKLIEIGKTESCSEDEMKFFLPDFPIPHGSETIFNITYSKLNKDCKDPKQLEKIIKGYHLVEMKYSELTGSQIGFGSPSKSNDLIDGLSKIDKTLANEVYKWIASNGGNYYIRETSRDN